MCRLVRLKTNQNKFIRVAENKRDCLKNMVSAAKKCEHIKQIVLFGSALESRCNEASDIDIAIISDISRSRLFQNKAFDLFKKEVYQFRVTQSYDFLYFSSMEQLRCGKDYICSEILNNGQTIYLRGSIPHGRRRVVTS